MLATENTSSVVAPETQAVVTGTDNGSIAHKEEANWQKWQDVIDYKLIEWGSNPGRLEDDGLDPPSPELIGRAITLAQQLQQQGKPSPTAVVPDANGGIIFRRKENNVTEEFRFWDDKTLEYCLYHSGKIVRRWVP